MYEAVEAYRHAFVNLPLEGCNCWALTLGHFTPEKRTLMPLREGAGGPLFGLKALEKREIPL
jgi:hypothetical protein